MPRTSYQQGMRRHFLKTDKFDYYWPEFAHLGEQPVYQGELYPVSDLKGTFGYQSRYAEYKFIPSSVHGNFKDNLAFWHLGRIFSGPPALNANFVQADPATRPFPTGTNSHKVWCQVFMDMQAIRPMPKFGTPTL